MTLCRQRNAGSKLHQVYCDLCAEMFEWPKGEKVFGFCDTCGRATWCTDVVLSGLPYAITKPYGRTFGDERERQAAMAAYQI